MAKTQQSDPQPISLENAQRIWALQKQNAPLSPADQKLLEQAAEWQMWVSHGIRLKSGNGGSKGNSRRSKAGREEPAAY